MWRVLPLTWISNLFQDSKIQFDFKSNLTSAISNFSESGHLVSYVSHHNAMAYDTCPHKWSYQTWKLCGKNLDMEKINRHDPGGHGRCKDSITIREAIDFVRVGERGIELIVLTFTFCLIYRTSSVNGCTLWILSLSILVPHWILIVPFVWTVVIVHVSLLYADSALQRIPSFITSTLSPTL